ncbi:MAG: STAS domain-containing protein [Phycisphaerales bacterium]|nr:STAS domain-containing protein [Phycisphaerales bacterium]
MPLNTWSENIMIAELSDEPMFSEDMDGLLQRLEEAVKSEESIPNVVVDLKSVATVNSSNLGALLKLRTTLGQNDRRLLICSITDGVWTALLATGLDRVFAFSENVTTALATLQMET